MLLPHFTDEPHPVLVPVRVTEACNHVTYQETEEREADLPEVETVVVGEHEGESTEKEV